MASRMKGRITYTDAGIMCISSQISGAHGCLRRRSSSLNFSSLKLKRVGMPQVGTVAGRICLTSPVYSPMRTGRSHHVALPCPWAIQPIRSAARKSKVSFLEFFLRKHVTQFLKCIAKCAKIPRRYCEILSAGMAAENARIIVPGDGSRGRFIAHFDQ